MIKIGDLVSIEFKFHNNWNKIGVGLVIERQQTGRYIDYQVLIDGQIDTCTELSTCRIKKL
jgi:hypothetical protein